MTQDASLAPLRQGGARAITIFLWLNQAMIMPVGLAIGSDRCWSAFMLGLAVLIAPSWCWHKGRIDASARLTFGIALVVYPMLFVYLFEGHPWQMDLHMHFFVCFSLMALLFDARPILLGAALTVLHHLLLYLVMPDWVFPGSGSVPRVLLHGFLVSCLVGTLLTTIRLIARLTMTNVSARAEADEARAGAEQALREADVARSRAEAALAQSREAEARAEHEQRERLAAEAALSDVSNERRTATANRIEEGIGVLVDDLLLVADKIAQQAKDIASVSSALVEQANGLGTSSASAVASIETVAASSEELTASIRQVSSNAESAQRVATAAAQSISTLEPGIAKLTHEVDAARDILAMVSQIATQSNLLALNATIEAARSGEAGRGFGVVANEMKQMASATGRAADEIAMKLASIVGAASVFKELIATSSAHADEIQASSLAIFAAVEQQQQATIAIGEGAERVLAKAVDTDRRSQTLTDVAGRNGSIAQDASVLARQLSERAEQLRGRMHALLGELRAA